MIIFDIETRPRLDLVSRYVKPFAPFDASAVKCGNIKDPVKIAEKVNGAKADHAQAEIDYWKDANDRAALNPLTGQIICIGTSLDGHSLINGDESGVLKAFWELFQTRPGEQFVYWSGSGNPSENFDVDYIVKRSWILGVEVPPGAFDGRYLGRKFVDAAARWLMYKREGYCSLSDAADQMGLFQSNPELKPKDKEKDLVTGANFHEFWDGKNEASGLPAETQRAFALSYLRNDIEILQAIAARIL